MTLAISPVKRASVDSLANAGTNVNGAGNGKRFTVAEIARKRARGAEEEPSAIRPDSQSLRKLAIASRRSCNTFNADAEVSDA